MELHLSRGNKPVGFIVPSRLFNKSLVSLSSLNMQFYCTPSVPEEQPKGLGYGKGSAVPQLLSCGGDTPVPTLGQVIPMVKAHEPLTGQMLNSQIFCPAQFKRALITLSPLSTCPFICFKIIWIVVFNLPYRGNFAFQLYCNPLPDWDVRIVTAPCCILTRLDTISFQIVQVISSNSISSQKFLFLNSSDEEQKCIYKCTKTSPKNIFCYLVVHKKF